MKSEEILNAINKKPMRVVQQRRWRENGPEMKKSKHPAAAKAMAKTFASGKSAYSKATPVLKKYIIASSNAEAFAKKKLKIWPKLFKSMEKLMVAMGSVVIDIEAAEVEMEDADDYSNEDRVKELEKVVAKLEAKYKAMDNKLLDIQTAFPAISGPMFEFAGEATKLASSYHKLIQKSC